MSAPVETTPTADLMIRSPVGPMRAAWTSQGLAFLHFTGPSESPALAPDEIECAASPAWSADSLAARLWTELSDYFARRRGEFTIPLAPAGTPFQRQVWDALRTIPAGQTRSYAQVARMIGRPAAVRAVARANATNPIAILIPCHRVIGSDGTLTGYAGGLDRKRWLLNHERGMLGVVAAELWSHTLP